MIITNQFSLNLGATAKLSGETNSSYILGSLSLSLPIGNSSSTCGNIGVIISSGTDDLGAVSVTRITGLDGQINFNGKAGINRKWIINSTNAPSSGRSITFDWLSSDDNGKNFKGSNKAEIWQSTGNSWSSISSPTDVSLSNPRGVTTTTIYSFATFTISDQKSAFKQFSASVTAMIEALNETGTYQPDTIQVLFANNSYPHNIIDSVIALQTTEAVVSFTPTKLANSESYFIVIKHRNSIETWSTAPVTVNNYSLTYDFTTSASQALGSNMVLVGSKYCIYSGDIDQEGLIGNVDLTLVDNDAFFTTEGACLATDLDSDGLVGNVDLTICDNNAFFLREVMRPGDFPVKPKHIIYPAINQTKN